MDQLGAREPLRAFAAVSTRGQRALGIWAPERGMASEWTASRVMAAAVAVWDAP